VIGVIAQGRDDVFDGLSSRAFIAEVDIELLLEERDEEQHFKAFSKYPDSLFEMSVVLKERDTYGELESFIVGNVDSSVLRKIEVVSLYRGTPLAADEKSLSVKLYLGRDDRTMDGEELTQIQESLLRSVDASRFSLRS